MRRAITVSVLSAFLLLGPASLPSEAGLLSKQYLFKKDVTLEMGAQVVPGLRLDSVRFEVPSAVDDRILRVSGLVRAQIFVSNTGAEARRFGIAMALFGDDDRLLGVASGGTGLRSLPAGRQRLYTLVFDKVSMEAAQSKTFFISIEPKP